MSVPCQLGAVPVQLDGLNNTLGPAVYGDIMLSIKNTHTKNLSNKEPLKATDLNAQYQIIRLQC